MSWLPTQSENSRPVAAYGDAAGDADAAHVPLPLPNPVVEVPAVAEPEREARRLGRRAKLALCGVGLAALGLACLMAYCGTSQARTKATVAPPKTAPPPSPVTPEQISSLAQGKATPASVNESATGATANIPGGFNGDPDNIFVTPTPLPGGGPPVTQATPLNNGVTGPNNLSGTVVGSPTVRPPTVVAGAYHDRLERYTLNASGVVIAGSVQVLVDQIGNSVWHNGSGRIA